MAGEWVNISKPCITCSGRLGWLAWNML